MKPVTGVILVIAVFCGCATGPKITEESVLEEMLALEHRGCETWFQSDPTVYAQAFAAKETYFDTVLWDRLDDGALKEHLMTFAGKIPNFGYKFVHPRVDLHGDAAIYTCDLEAYDPNNGKLVVRWKSTAVLVPSGSDWKKVHAPWTGVPLP